MRRQIPLFIGDKINPDVSQQSLAIIIAAAKRPDEGSVFDRATRDIRHLSDVEFVEKLKERHYNALIALEHESMFAGFLGYQNRDGAWHCFALRTQEGIESSGIGKGLARAFLQAAKDAGMKRVFLWGGDRKNELTPDNRARMEAIYSSASGNKLGLKFEVAAGSKPGEIILDLAQRSSAA